MIEWISCNMEFVLMFIMGAEKAVMMSKSKHQDIIVSCLKGFFKFLNRKKK